MLMNYHSDLNKARKIMFFVKIIIGVEYAIKTRIDDEKVGKDVKRGLRMGERWFMVFLIPT